MDSTLSVSASERVLEDPLSYLPCSNIVSYKAGEDIYSDEKSNEDLHLIISGKVKISRLLDDGRQIVMDIYRSDEFFGEAAFLGVPNAVERAVPLETTSIMAWNIAEIEEIAIKRPQLAIALMQLFLQRLADSTARIESLAVDSMARRLARTLIRYAERFGTAQDDGSIRMMALTHEFLSQYIGTTREIVTHALNQFRRMGLVQYSRVGLSVYPGLQAWMTSGEVSVRKRQDLLA